MNLALHVPARRIAIVYGVGLAVLSVVLLARRIIVPTRADATRITDQVVIERVRAVAKLVSSETSVRDVVVYRNRWFGSEKRSLIVVTGTVLAGIVLDSTMHVAVDDRARTIALDIPHARVLDVDVMRLETYDARLCGIHTFPVVV